MRASTQTQGRDIENWSLSHLDARVQHESSLFVPWTGNKKKVSAFERADCSAAQPNIFGAGAHTTHTQRRKCDVKSACLRGQRSKTQAQIRRPLFIHVASGLWPLGKLRGLKTPDGSKGCASLSESMCARACEWEGALILGCFWWGEHAAAAAWAYRRRRLLNGVMIISRRLKGNIKFCVYTKSSLAQSPHSHQDSLARLCRHVCAKFANFAPPTVDAGD